MCSSRCSSDFGIPEEKDSLAKSAKIAKKEFGKFHIPELGELGDLGESHSSIPTYAMNGANAASTRCSCSGVTLLDSAR